MEDNFLFKSNFHLLKSCVISAEKRTEMKKLILQDPLQQGRSVFQENLWKKKVLANVTVRK